MKEEWIEIRGLPKYQISNFGRVKTTKTGLIRKASKKSDGYLYVSMYNEGKVYAKYIAGLVAKHFIENPLNLPEVNHKDLNKENNVYTNLEWIDRAGNMQHAYLTKTIRRKKVYAYNANTKEVIEFHSHRECSKHFSMKGFSNSMKKGHKIKGVYAVFHEAEWQQFQNSQLLNK